MIDIVERLRFDATRCEATFSKGVATNIEEGAAEIERLRAILQNVALAIGVDDHEFRAFIGIEQSEEPSNFHDLRGVFKDGR
jgi:hypothetical protein